MDDCIFCKIVKGDIPSIRIYEDEHVLAFMDIHPLSEGHALVIPKMHAENLWEIPEAALFAVHRVSKKIVHAMTRAMGPVSVAAIQLNGRGVNQVVMHYHLHLIPRASDGETLKLTAWEMIPGDMDAIIRKGAAIAAAVENNKDQKERR
jgi:histidine triad (HIT) family protein